MNAQNIGDILHVSILTLILVWLFYHQWEINKIIDLMREMAEKMPGSEKEEDRNNNRRDDDFMK